MIDNDAIEETMMERFAELCQVDVDIENLVWVNFANNLEQWRYWKEGIWSEEPEERAFRYFCNLDAEHFFYDMKGFVEKYAERNKEKD